MIYILLILFLGSLAAIAFMVSQKIVLIKSGKIQISEEDSFEVPYVREARDLGIVHAKKLEHRGLVAIIRYYVLSTNFLKKKYRAIRERMQHVHNNNYKNTELKEKVDSSKIVKIMSNYRHRIKTIKADIRQQHENKPE